MFYTYFTFSSEIELEDDPTWSAVSGQKPFDATSQQR
jgi:hypothetical protein